MNRKTFVLLVLGMTLLAALSRAACTDSKLVNDLLICEENERDGGMKNLTAHRLGKRDLFGKPRCPEPTINVNFIEGKLQRKKYDKILRGEMKDDKVFRFILFYYPLCSYSRQMYSKVNAMGLIFHDKAEFYTVGVSGSEDSQKYPLMFKVLKSLYFQYVPVAYLFKGKKMLFKIDGDVDVTYLFNRIKAGLHISKAEAKELMSVSEAEATLNGTHAYLDKISDEMEKGSSMFIILSYMYVAWEICCFVYKHFIRKTPDRANDDSNNNNNNNDNGQPNDGDDNDDVAQLFIEQQQ